MIYQSRPRPRVVATIPVYENSGTSLGSHDVGSGDGRYLLLMVYIAAGGNTGANVSVGGNACSLLASQSRFFGVGTWDNLHIQGLDLDAAGLSGSVAFTMANPGFVTVISGCVVSRVNALYGQAVEVGTQNVSTSLTATPNLADLEPSFAFTALCTRAQGGNFSISSPSSLLTIGAQGNRSSVRVGYATGLAPTGTQTFTPAASSVNLMNVASIPAN